MNPGDYYKRKYEEVRLINKELQKVITDRKPEKEIKRIKAKLELARYVGD